jgi:ABC-type Na+ efflux pump permease subunit
VSAGIAGERKAALFKIFGVDEFARVRTGKLSSGMKRRFLACLHRSVSHGSIYGAIGALSLAIDAVAREKEQGTMTALLVTPLKRGELAAGKVLGTALLSFLSGLCLSAGALIAVVSLLTGPFPNPGDRRGKKANLPPYHFRTRENTVPAKQGVPGIRVNERSKHT